MTNRNRPTGSAFVQRGTGPTPAEAAAGVYGGNADLTAIDAQRQVARLIPLTEIEPDRRQPRHVFPHQAAPQDTGQAAIAAALQRWLELAEEESSRAFPLQAYLDPGSGYERPSAPGPVEHRLIELVDLAADILNLGGLTLPIKVSRSGSGYVIESGERRWLAHWLLHLHTGDESYLRIMAHVVDRPSVWRQASENGVRTNLNAISRARQLALLLMDIYAKTGITFTDYAELVPAGSCDRAYYAQVADGETYRVPRGYAERITGVMGLKSATQIRQYRALLRMDDTLWQQADDGDLDEAQIRQMMASNHHSVTTVTVSELPRPFVVKFPARTADKWALVKSAMPDVPDGQIAETLLDFYLSHQARKEE